MTKRTKFGYAGYVVEIGPDTNPNYFTGVSYSAFINEAKIFRSTAGAMSAARYWQTADHNPHKLPSVWYDTRRAVPVVMAIAS